jgi:hypothetical protein
MFAFSQFYLQTETKVELIDLLILFVWLVLLRVFSVFEVQFREFSEYKESDCFYFLSIYICFILILDFDFSFA